MGQHAVLSSTDDKRRTEFIHHLITDMDVLERMVRDRRFPDSPIHIGAEQEFCLVDSNWRPSRDSQDILDQINDSHFTSELARYNLEVNLDPLKLQASCFSDMHNELDELMKHAASIAERHDNRIILTGILPTISKTELHLDYMTPVPRYKLLNDALLRAKGSDFELHLRGVDELTIKHDSVLFEACNTSFQIHLQVDPYDFAASYNWAQAISGPVLAVATNSPMLLGRELWDETRIALFRQSVDTRKSTRTLRDRDPRVNFGRRWIKDCVTEIYKEDLSRFAPLISVDIQESSLDQLTRGEAPKLKALATHNSTVYRWNRPCYGVNDGIPHLRIENRYIPSGPTTLDEMANMVFWVGLMKARPDEWNDAASQMDFREVQKNFLKAARNGIESQLMWNGRRIGAGKLAETELLPMAYKGLEKAGIDRSEAEKYLNVMAERINGRTGSQWITQSFRNLSKTHRNGESRVRIVKEMWKNQQNPSPGHSWEVIEPYDKKPKQLDLPVWQVMSTSLLTVQAEDPARLVANVMDWNDIHHMPVEDVDGKLIGLLTLSHMQKHKELIIQGLKVRVHEVMIEKVITIDPELPVRKAMELMKRENVGCLPVVNKNGMVGLITAQDMEEQMYGKCLE